MIFLSLSWIKTQSNYAGTSSKFRNKNIYQSIYYYVTGLEKDFVIGESYPTVENGNYQVQNGMSFDFKLSKSGPEIGIGYEQNKTSIVKDIELTTSGVDNVTYGTKFNYYFTKFGEDNPVAKSDYVGKAYDTFMLKNVSKHIGQKMYFNFDYGAEFYAHEFWQEFYDVATYDSLNHMDLNRSVEYVIEV
jgi:hypothetical protein